MLYDVCVWKIKMSIFTTMFQSTIYSVFSFFISRTCSSLHCLLGEVVNLFCILSGTWTADDGLTVGRILAVRCLIPSVKFMVNKVDGRSRTAECIIDQYIDIFAAQRPIPGCLWWFWSITRYLVELLMQYQHVTYGITGFCFCCRGSCCV